MRGDYQPIASLALGVRLVETDVLLLSSLSFQTGVPAGCQSGCLAVGKGVKVAG